MSATQRTGLIDWAGPPTRPLFRFLFRATKKCWNSTASTKTRSHDHGDQPRAISHYTTNMTVQKYIRIDSNFEIGKHFLKIASSFKMPHFFVFHIFGKVKVFCNSDFKMKHEQNLQTQTDSKNANNFQRKYLKNKQITKITNTFWDCEQFLVFLENI